MKTQAIAQKQSQNDGPCMKYIFRHHPRRAQNFSPSICLRQKCRCPRSLPFSLIGQRRETGLVKQWDFLLHNGGLKKHAERTENCGFYLNNIQSLFLEPDMVSFSSSWFEHGKGVIHCAIECCHRSNLVLLFTLWNLCHLCIIISSHWGSFNKAHIKDNIWLYISKLLHFYKD